MKIAIITATFPPYAGGIGNVAAYNAQQLVKLGHQVEVFTPLYGPVEEEFLGLKVNRLKPLIKYGNAALILGWKKRLTGFDIIHLHYPFFGGAEPIWWQAKKLKKKGAKIVLHYHMDVVGRGISKTFFTFHTKLILPWLAAVADKIIFTSLDYGRHSSIAALINSAPAKFAEVPNGVDSRNFLPENKDLGFLAKHEIDPSEKIILFVGGLDKAHYFKGIEYLIQTASLLREVHYQWRLVIVGAGDLKSYYQDLAGQFNISHRTIFTGYVPNTDLPKYYSLADVVVLPSVDKSEAFGMTLIEGMSCGKPVIATNLAGVRSVVENEVNGFLVNPKDAADLAAKINYLFTNPEIARQFGQAGRKKVEEKYDWARIGVQLDEIYKSLK